MTPRNLARLAHLRHLFDGGRWRERYTADELATLDGAYDHITADDIVAAHPWVELAERYGSVVVFPALAGTDDDRVLIDVTRPTRSFCVSLRPAGAWCAASLTDDDGSHSSTGTGIDALTAWLTSIGWHPWVLRREGERWVVDGPDGRLGDYAAEVEAVEALYEAGAVGWRREGPSHPDPEEHAMSLLVEALSLANDRQTVPLALLREALVYLGLDGSASLRVDAVECIPVGWVP